MSRERLLDAILNGLKDPVLFAGLDHVITYMNDAAAKHYTSGRALLGQSLLDCHNERSCQVIEDTLKLLESGENEVLTYEGEEKRLYMCAVRDTDGSLLGYYERYEALAEL